MSDFVPVPDNQEVFNVGELEATVVVEILERVEQEDANAAGYIFTDLAEVNEASEGRFGKIEGVREVSDAEVPGIRAGCPKYLLVGEQWIHPNQSPDTPRDQVKILLFLLRLPEVNSELVITVNYPCRDKSGELLQREWQALNRALERVLQTLKINDMTLFGE